MSKKASKTAQTAPQTAPPPVAPPDGDRPAASEEAANLPDVKHPEAGEVVPQAESGFISKNKQDERTWWPPHDSGAGFFGGAESKGR